MFTNGSLFYITLSCLKKCPINSIFITALLYAGLGGWLLRSWGEKLIFSLDNPFDSHQEFLLLSILKYLCTG